MYGKKIETKKSGDITKSEAIHKSKFLIIRVLSVPRSKGPRDFSKLLFCFIALESRNKVFFFSFTTELNHPLKEFNVTISPDQLAEDFRTLRERLSRFPGVDNFLVGPDVTQPRGNAMGFLKV